MYQISKSKKYLVTKRVTGSTEILESVSFSCWRLGLAQLQYMDDGIEFGQLPSDSDITELHGASVQGERFTYWIHLIS